MSLAGPIIMRCAAIAGAAIAALLGACASAEAVQAVPPGTPAFEVLRQAPAPADAAVRSQDAEPLVEATSYWATLPDRPGARPAFHAERTERTPDGRWVRTAEDGVRTLGQDIDGTVRLLSQRDAKDGATTEFRPPLAIAPPELGAAADFASEAVVGVTRGTVTEPNAGRAQRSVRLTGLDRVRTPMGEADALRTETTFTMKVPFASLRRDTTTWVVRGTGPVAVRVDERVLVMGVVPRDRHETRVRLPRKPEDTP
jgi:hypothetical protein